MRKREDEKYEKEVEVAQKAIARNGSTENETAGKDISVERMDELVEDTHRTSQINRMAAERKLVMRLDVMRRFRRMRLRWTYAGCAAAALALFFVVQPWLLPERQTATPP